MQLTVRTRAPARITAGLVFATTAGNIDQGDPKVEDKDIVDD
jgi:hypothetical protein